MIPVILNFTVRSFSNSESSSKCYVRDEIFKCIKDSFLLCLAIFLLFSWSIVWCLQFVSSFSVKALIFSNIVGSCSLFLGIILKPEVNASNSLSFKLEKWISFPRKYSTKDLGTFAVVYRFVCKYYCNECVPNSHICHNKSNCDLWQQASHILCKKT